MEKHRYRERRRNGERHGETTRDRDRQGETSRAKRMGLRLKERGRD